MRLAVVFALCVASGSATGVAAQVTQTYAYDAAGRLTGVTTSGASGTNSASYTYDDANNRTLRGQSGVSAYAAVRELPVNRLLQPYEALISPDGAWSLALRSSGRLELWRGEAPMPLAAADAFALTPEGEVLFLPPVSVTGGNEVLELASDGALSLRNSANEEVWRSVSTRSAEARP